MPNNPNAADNLKPYKPGESGNPEGRPPGCKSMKTRAIELLSDMAEDGEYATPLCNALIDVLKTPENAKPSEIIKATEVLRDTIEGKPTQKIEQTNEDVTPAKLDNLNDKDLREMSRIQKKLEE